MSFDCAADNTPSFTSLSRVFRIASAAFGRQKYQTPT